jgi:sulfate/thiosulfate-binding protein
MIRWRSIGVALAVVATVAAAGCTGAKADGAKVKLSLVAYSTPQVAYEAIIKAFQKTPEGRNVRFSQSYGASGDQSRSVESGLAADFVAFSLEPDMTRLVKAGIVAEDWASGPSQGVVTRSVVVLTTRRGNPKGIRNWDDLIRPGVQVITPNPFTSGGAKWNILASYWRASKNGTDKAAGVAYLSSLFKNVPVQDDSGRKSLQTFTNGKGDVALTYENEAIFAQRNKQPVDYVVPDSTILIENPVAVTKNSKHPKEAAAFLKFVYSVKGQQLFADNGYRPAIQDGVSAQFPTPPGLFTIRDLGGWTKVNKDFFDPQASILADIERSIGVTTTK